MIKLKVSDLLKNSGSEDNIKLEKIKIDLIPDLVWDMICLDLKIQSINDTTIVATITNLTAYIKSISEISNKEFVRKVFCEKYETRFVVSWFKNELDDDLDIDNSWNIDIEKMIYDCILLQNPPVICDEDEL